MLRLVALMFFVALLNCVELAIAVPAIKVMSFNVRFDANPGVATERDNAWTAKSGLHRREQACQVIREYSPDVLCVQEALSNQVDDLRVNMPSHEYYGVGRDDGVEAGECCGILYRKDRFVCLESGTFWLNEDLSRAGSRFPGTCCARIASWCVLQDREQSLREIMVLNTHWDHQVQAARVFSAQLIRRKLMSVAEGRPVIVAGDLNVPDNNPAFRLLVQSTEENSLELLDSYRLTHPKVAADEGTFHGFRGGVEGNRIDYVLHDSKFRTVRAAIVRTHEGKRYPSDHYPVTATLELLLD